MSGSFPKLLDLIPKNKQWVLNKGGEERRNGSSSSDENNKLELRLGLPGDEGLFGENSLNNSSFRERSDSSLSLSYFSYQNPWQPNTASPFLHHHNHQYQTGPKGLPVMAKESEKKAFSPPASANTAVPNTSQKRAAPAPVVGWPPIRSFRKNLASTSSAKPVSEPHNVNQSKSLNEKPSAKNSQKGLFVKINMDGIPIGRKVDLNAYDSYPKLSSSVDELFRGLLAAQRDSSGGVMDDNKQQEQKPITGLLDGSGEYTLVYEDNEGDRMLVGDVPWHMFVSTVKRLRVLKSSDLPTLSRGGSKEDKVPVENASK